MSAPAEKPLPRNLFARSMVCAWRTVIGHSVGTILVALAIIGASIWFTKTFRSADAVNEYIYGSLIAAGASVAVFISIFLVNVIFVTPRALRKEAEDALERLRSKLDVQCGPKVEKSVVFDPLKRKTFYRARVVFAGEKPVQEFTARLENIRADGRDVALPEPITLTIHPNISVVTLKPGRAELVDLIVIASGQYGLFVQFPTELLPGAVKLAFVNNVKYELDVCFSGVGMLTRNCTFIFHYNPPSAGSTVVLQ